MHRPTPDQSYEVTLSYTNIWRHFVTRGNKQHTSDAVLVTRWLSLMFPGIAKMEVTYASVKSNSEEMLDNDKKSYSPCSSRSSSSSSSCVQEPAGSDVQWQISQVKKGCLHLVVGDCMLASGRTLHRPESGTGLNEAFSTGRAWSPRCEAAILDHEQKWWADAHLPPTE